MPHSNEVFSPLIVMSDEEDLVNGSSRYGRTKELRKALQKKPKFQDPSSSSSGESSEEEEAERGKDFTVPPAQLAVAQERKADTQDESEDENTQDCYLGTVTSEQIVQGQRLLDRLDSITEDIPLSSTLKEDQLNETVDLVDSDSECEEEDEDDDEEEEDYELKFKSSDGVQMLHASRNKPFQLVLDQFCKQFGNNRKVLFKIDGEKVKGSQTPADLDLESGDQIDVKFTS